MPQHGEQPDGRGIRFFREVLLGGQDRQRRHFRSEKCSEQVDDIRGAVQVKFNYNSLNLNYKYEIYAATLGRQRLLKDLFDQNQTKFPFQR